jgi:hypothetical protein
MATTSQQLEDAIKAAEAANAKVDEIKKLSREQDLKTAKQLIAAHGFTQTDLKPELKVGRGGAAKRVSSPRKSPTRRKTK